MSDLLTSVIARLERDENRDGQSLLMSYVREICAICSVSMRHVWRLVTAWFIANRLVRPPRDDFVVK